MKNSSKFILKSPYKPSGDQPEAIKSLIAGLKKGEKHQTLLGVTGSGKTFTMANVIASVQKPTLVIAHNKTLAAQLAQEYREFFPDNAVHYFVSYYDYYQPEAYKPTTDTYIEKEAMINEEIERLRHASTQALLTRDDVIIVASVSCIYGLGSPEEYRKTNFEIKEGMRLNRMDCVRKLISLHYERTNSDLSPGTFRAKGNVIELMPISERYIFKISFDEEKIINLSKIDAITRSILESNISSFFVFPAKHFVTDKEQTEVALKRIESELKERLKELEKEGKILEAERLKRRTKYDLALIREVGYCTGIENYSRHFSERLAGNPPDTLLSYFPEDFLTVIDESHVTIPQIQGMYAGDYSRKSTLVEHGFRLPSAKDNRPLKFNEFEEKVNQCIYTSATPGEYEKENSSRIVEQIIRPTGLIDPVIEIKRVSEKGMYKGQVYDFIQEIQKETQKEGRVLATTLTKKMAEELSSYLIEKGIKTTYLHSDVKTIERIEIITNFRRGQFDVLVGVNLLREGLDMPEVTLIGILDADKEGFLRSETSLIQTIGRAARNVDGRVILYADTITGSMQRAIDETNRRRKIQVEYNEKNNITPKTIQKAIRDITEHMKTEHQKTVDLLLNLDVNSLDKKEIKKLIKEKERQMNEAAKELDFETAAIIRDELVEIKKKLKK